MEVKSVLVTGANRGIGLEFVRQLVNLLEPPKYVFATYRSKDTIQDLEDIRMAYKKTQVILLQMDVTKTEDVEAARKVVEDTVGDEGLNLIINNAGRAEMQPFPAVTEENIFSHFTANTVGPIKVLKEMLPLLQKAAKLQEGKMSVSRAAALNISSMGGSILNVKNTPPEWLGPFSYRMSKAALNMAMRLIGDTIKDQGILIVNMCPGWVRTDMGTAAGLIDVNESISSMLKTLPTLNESHQGSFLDRNGEVIPF